MNLKFIQIKEFGLWFPKIKYCFEISYEDNENIEVFEKEFKLNCKNQLEYYE